MRDSVLVRSALFALALMLSPVAAISKCGTNNPISYNDVDAVMISQGGGMLRVMGRSHPSIFDESMFWALFATGEATTYSQYDLTGKVGTYHLSANINQARAVLRRNHFYRLSSSGVSATDTSQKVVAVERCEVVTKIRIYDMEARYQDPATLQLFDDMLKLVSHTKATKISQRPTKFSTLWFNPEETILGH